MHPYSYSVSLRVKHPSRELSYLSSLLQLEPKRILKFGDKRETPKGAMLEGTYPESYWYSVITNEKEESESISLESTLEQWTDKLEPHKNEFQKIRTEGGTIEYFIWL